MRLSEIASVVRSKNAGPRLLTLDIIFPTRDLFERACLKAKALEDYVASAYKTPSTSIRLFTFEPALAIKVTIPRKIQAGSMGDSDVYGAQQHAPLLDFVL